MGRKTTLRSYQNCANDSAIRSKSLRNGGRAARQAASARFPAVSSESAGDSDEERSFRPGGDGRVLASHKLTGPLPLQFQTSGNNRFPPAHTLSVGAYSQKKLLCTGNSFSKESV